MATNSERFESQQVTNRLVLKNTLFLVGAKVLATPLSVITNAVIARYLGPADYSYIYLATTYASFGMLFVQFGQFGTLPALVATDRARAGELLGSALAWQVLAGVLVYALLAGGSEAFGYDIEFQYALALVVLSSLVGSATSAILETIRGFERTDVDALVNVGAPFLSGAITIPVVMLGGRLVAALSVGVLVAMVSLLFVSRFLKPVGVGTIQARRGTIKVLLAKGYPFLFFGIAMAVQPTVDAGFLSKLSPPDVVGWYAAAKKLVGLLVFPAAALITALYPVLCRLFSEDQESYRRTANTALQISTLLMVPVAMGCALFPDIGIRVYGEEKFGEAEANLRVLSIFVFLVYFSMPLGSAVLAAGRTHAWSLVQGLCVLISVVLDPLLVSWFQEHNGNGGLGICFSNIVSEVLMVSLGLWLLPKGVLTRETWKVFGSAILGSAAMAAAAWPLSGLSSFIVAPATVLAYATALLLTGNLNRQRLETVRSMIARRRG